jgi:hypothetical protein
MNIEQIRDYCLAYHFIQVIGQVFSDSAIVAYLMRSTSDIGVQSRFRKFQVI